MFDIRVVFLLRVGCFLERRRNVHLQDEARSHVSCCIYYVAIDKLEAGALDCISCSSCGCFLVKLALGYESDELCKLTVL